MKHPKTAGIRNRSPWQVAVRHYPALSRVFPFPQSEAAVSYGAEMKSKGYSAKLTQLATAFELRVRRVGMRDQFLTFDALEQAVQAKLKMDSDMSLHIVRDYGAASLCLAVGLCVVGAWGHLSQLFIAAMSRYNAIVCSQVRNPAFDIRDSPPESARAGNN